MESTDSLPLEDFAPVSPPLGKVDIQLARRRLQKIARYTPLLESDRLNAIAGRRILVKAECLQHTGSFKFRGAYNCVCAICEQTGAKTPIVACSSGNHAQGVALAAQLCGCKASVIMPRDAPRVKIDNTKFYGARIISYDRNKDDREIIAQTQAAEQNGVFIHPYEDFHVIAGQGTCGLEIAEQCKASKITPDAVVVCAGGGGFVSGITLALHDVWPDTKFYTAEPQGYDDWRRSLQTGERVGNLPAVDSICDAMLAPCPGKTPFSFVSSLLSGGLCASQQDICRAMRLAFSHLKLVLEPSGAVALGAILAGEIADARMIVVTASGGNVDAALFSTIIA